VAFIDHLDQLDARVSLTVLEGGETRTWSRSELGKRPRSRRVTFSPASRLAAPDPPVLEVPAVALVLWFVSVGLALRHRVVERILGLRLDTSASGADQQALLQRGHRATSG
jgi:hypothetical protein